MEQILLLIEQYYDMKDGEFIDNHQSFFVVHDDEIEVRLKYKTIKHIVEKRKKDGYGIKEIVDLFEKMSVLLKYWDYTVIEDKGNNSYLLIQNDYDNEGLMIALDINLENDSIHIKTLYLKASSKIKKLLKTKNPPK
ncbi:hypothetical protein H7Y21_00780 [Arenimonas sp.]|nr:hypothetical protein [Candidatus Parcubacteria bacterium]